MFIVLLFTIAKIWKQTKGTSMDEWIKKNFFVYTMGFSYEKEGDLATCDNMDGP